MLRRLSRLLIIALLLAVIALAASRLMGGDDDDFDEFDDLDSGFEFQETPVEIDVPAQEAATPAPEQYTASQDDTTADIIVSEEAAAETSDSSDIVDGNADTGNGNSDTGNDGRLVDINGIGPAYEARLQAIGIQSISDLANADADSIASQIEVIGGAGTIGEWIDQAKQYATGGQS